MGPTEEISSFEGVVESLLRALRDEKQRRWEKQLQSVQRRHAEENKALQNLEEEQSCIICNEFPRAILLLLCRHLCVCESCGKQLDACPICRATIQEQVHCL